MKRIFAAGALVVLLVAIAPVARAQDRLDPDVMDVRDITHLGEDRWRATGTANDDDDCNPPHRIGMMEATPGAVPGDASRAQTIGRVQGDWSLEFVAPFEEVWVIVFCDDRHLNEEFTRAIVRGDRTALLPRTDGEAAAEAPPAGGAPIGLVAGGVGVAVLLAAAALVMRARRPARQDAGDHARCVARHVAATKQLTAAKARATAAVDALDTGITMARGAFDDLLGERDAVEALIDDTVRQSDE